MWVLHWSVFEVIGFDALPVAIKGALATVMAAQPPAAFPAEDVAHLRLNADGEVAWIILGATSRGDVVPYAGAPQ